MKFQKKAFSYRKVIKNDLASFCVSKLVTFQKKFKPPENGHFLKKKTGMVTGDTSQRTSQRFWKTGEKKSHSALKEFCSVIILGHPGRMTFWPRNKDFLKFQNALNPYHEKVTKNVLVLGLFFFAEWLFFFFNLHFFRKNRGDVCSLPSFTFWIFFSLLTPWHFLKSAEIQKKTH